MPAAARIDRLVAWAEHAGRSAVSLGFCTTALADYKARREMETQIAVDAAHDAAGSERKCCLMALDCRSLDAAFSDGKRSVQRGKWLALVADIEAVPAGARDID